MRRALTIAGVLAAAGLTVTFSMAQAPAPQSPTTSLDPSSVAAVFNGRDIKISDLDSEIQRKPQLSMLQAYSGGDPAVTNRIRMAALNGLINRQLLLSAARNSGAIDEKEIQQSVDNLVTQYGGKEKLTPLLANIKTTFEIFTAEVADDFRINSFIDKNVAKNLKSTDDEIKKAFDSAPDKYAAKEAVQASHILLKLPPDASAQDEEATKKKMEEIYTKAIAPGADFAALAKQYSQDGSAPGGGDLGMIELGKTVPAFEKAAFALKPGEISKPVRSEFGYHLIKVTQRRAAEKADFAKAKPLIEQELQMRKRQQAIESKVSELRAAAQIKINIPTT